MTDQMPCKVFPTGYLSFHQFVQPIQRDEDDKHNGNADR